METKLTGEIEFEEYLYGKFWMDLDNRLSNVHSNVEKKLYSEAYVQASEAIKDLKAVRRVIEKLEKIKKGM